MSPDPDEAEAYETAGQRHYQAGAYEAAAQAFAQAERTHRASGSELRAAEMANNRAVALLQISHHAEALEAVTGTPVQFERAGHWLLAGQAHGNLAAAFEGLGDFDRAEASYRRALELFEQAGDDKSRTHTAKACSRLQLRRGRPLEAVTTMQRGLAADSQLPLRDRFLRWLLQLPSRLLSG